MNPFTLFSLDSRRGVVETVFAFTSAHRHSRLCVAVCSSLYLRLVEGVIYNTKQYLFETINNSHKLSHLFPQKVIPINHCSSHLIFFCRAQPNTDFPAKFYETFMNSNRTTFFFLFIYHFHTIRLPSWCRRDRGRFHERAPALSVVRVCV